MAEHFEEIVTLRLSALETRVDAEVGAVEQHFAEQRQFIRHSLNQLGADLRGSTAAGFNELRSEMTAEFRDVRADLRRLERDFSRLEQKLDAQLGAIQAILRRAGL